MKNIGIIGCGYWGVKHARVLSELQTARLYTVVDMDQDKVKAVTGKYEDVKGSNNPKELLNDPEIDGVIIATPASTHYRLALEALNAGKHVLVEKPLSIFPQEAQRLIDCASERHLTLMVGHTFEYHPAVEVLRNILKIG